MYWGLGAGVALGASQAHRTLTPAPDVLGRGRRTSHSIERRRVHGEALLELVDLIVPRYEAGLAPADDILAEGFSSIAARPVALGLPLLALEMDQMAGGGQADATELLAIARRDELYLHIGLERVAAVAMTPLPTPSVVRLAMAGFVGHVGWSLRVGVEAEVHCFSHIVPAAWRPPAGGEHGQGGGAHLRRQRGTWERREGEHGRTILRRQIH